MQIDAWLASQDLVEQIMIIPIGHPRLHLMDMIPDMLSLFCF